ncbi:ATP-binding cassette domain-containing protein [Clostridium estertheticum]|uniref:ATP-binding cassette domain-containing protein n=1 Tax=Clostridium estertheticum TaxID=238834 RepID=UPI001CCF91D2|nr:ATP-binding cassette domain-containing protein [Clostridium estertheticum]MBZ9609561.1 ATP-binding cassette domain-containing protein [Clostridium estertheticum]
MGKSNVSKQKVELALKRADIYQFVDNLPQGWNTVIGENGIRLSGGEKQRLAIARAVFRNAPILIFDEATSMLDNETENTIMQQILSLFKDKTIILIAHRLSTVKNADITSVLKGGHIIEEGTHQQLIQLKGLYYKLYTT